MKALWGQMPERHAQTPEIPPVLATRGSAPHELSLNVSQQCDKPLNHPLMYMFPAEETETSASPEGKGYGL